MEISQYFDRRVNDHRLFLEILNERSQIGVFLAHKNKILYQNKYLSDLLEFSAQELDGSILLDLVVEEDRDYISTGIWKQIHDRIKVQSYFLRLHTKSGKPKQLKVHLEIINLQGEMAFLGSAIEMTDRMQINSRHNIAYERFLKLSPEAIIHHHNGIITYINDNGLRLLGMDEEEAVIGTTLFQWFHDNVHDLIKKRMIRALETNEQLEFVEVQLIRQDGKAIDVEISSIYIYKYVNIPVIQTVVRDITERKRTEEYIRNSEKLSVVGQLASGIAHEIRNPLTALKGFTQLLKSRHTGDEKYFDIMMKELDRINTIVTELMLLAKPREQHFETYDLCHTVQDVIQLLSTQAIMNNIEIHFSQEVESAIVSCVEEQIKQVLINIIKNAIEAIDNDGHIHVSLDYVDSFYLIRIADDGEGIPEDILSSIGQPFFTTKATGTGLGLVVCNRIIEYHKGSLNISSKLGQGTTIDILLPV